MLVDVTLCTLAGAESRRNGGQRSYSLAVTIVAKADPALVDAPPGALAVVEEKRIDGWSASLAAGALEAVATEALVDALPGAVVDVEDGRKGRKRSAGRAGVFKRKEREGVEGHVGRAGALVSKADACLVSVAPFALSDGDG